MAAIARVHDTKHMLNTFNEVKPTLYSRCLYEIWGVLALLKTNLAWSSEFDSQNPVQDGNHVICFYNTYLRRYGIAPQMEIIYA